MLPWTFSGSIGCVFLGLFLVCTGGILGIFWPTIYNQIVTSNLRLQPGGMSYGLWKDPPITMYIEFYFFNWTNSEEILEVGKKPNLEEIGPYRFIEVKQKKEIVWHANNTISFKQERRWYFDPDNSNGSLSDDLTTINVIALTSAYVSRDWSYFLVLPLSQILKSHSIAITHTVGEFLFEGFDDPLIKLGKVGSVFAKDIQVPYDKFGWFYTRNGSLDYEGDFNMDTGMGDISKMGVLEQWRYQNQTKYFPGSCGKITGSAGELFPPSRQKNESIEIYSTDICRSLYFDYTEEVSIESVSGYQYSGGLRNIDNGTLDPHNDCYCGGNCVPSGAVNVSTCRFGAPAFVSYPHFYQADPYYLEQVNGLKPDKDKHSFYITLEPTTGIPLDVSARLQINVLMQSYKNIPLFKNLPKVFFPMLWFQQRATITPELAASLRQLLMLSPLGSIAAVVTFTIGITTLLAIAAVHCYNKQVTKTKMQTNLKMITSAEAISPLMSKRLPMESAIADSVYYDASDKMLDSPYKVAISKTIALQRDKSSQI